MAAGLNNTNADALAALICTALGIVDAASQAKMQTQWRTVYTKLAADIAMTIQINAITTAGGPATQQGPTAPLTLTPNT